MPKVLIAAPRTFGTPRSLARAFLPLCWETHVVNFHSSFQQFLLRRLWMHLKPGLDSRLAVQRDFNRVMRQQFIPQAIEEKPELLLIVKPHRLDDDVAQALTRLSAPIVTWATDSLERGEGQNSLLRHSLAAYVVDGGNVSQDKMHWLPLGFDDSIFRPASGPKRWDVLFVGNMSSKLYSRRYAFFHKLVDSGLHRDHRLGFIGETPSRIYNYLGCYPGKIHYVAPHLPTRELARAIALSRVVVNIHQDDGLVPINPMFFGIPGCRVCQVAEDREYLGRWLKPGVEYVTVNSANFIEVLTELLRNDSEMERISAVAFAASGQHTYVARFRQILAECGFLPHRGPQGAAS